MLSKIIGFVALSLLVVFDFILGQFVLSGMQPVKKTCLKGAYMRTSSQTECLLECKRIQMNAVHESDVCYCIEPCQCIANNDASFSNVLKYVFEIGNSKENPGTSCKVIKNLCLSCGNGFYWIKVDDEVVKVYCEMETDGGGWIMLTHTNVSHESEASIRHYDRIKSDDITLLHTAYSSGSFALSVEGVAKLYHNIGMKEFRVYCYKPSTQRTVHFVINSDMVTNFEDWFLTSHTRTASVSQVSAVPGVNPYRHLPDDNSLLKGYDNPLLRTLYDHVLYKSYMAHVVIVNRMDCDDFDEFNDYSPVGVWKFYGR